MVHRTLMDSDNSYSLDPWSDSSQDFDDSSRAGHGSSQAYNNSHAGHGSTFSLMHDGFMDWENVVTPTQSPIPAVRPPIPAQSTPIQSPSPVQSPTPVRPQRNAILSNISMHADNSPNYILILQQKLRLLNLQTHQLLVFDKMTVLSNLLPALL